ncbi:MAG TPA: TetR/AcrR family transcriptional regulator [Candidatus Methylacidiphilales bacterium]
MRYPRDHKEKSRHKIITVAAKEYRRRGIAGFGVGDAMKGAGLTKGAFYAHFSSKEELVREALHEAMTSSPVLVDGERNKSLEQVLSHDLDTDHRDHPEKGCPIPSLIEEVARHPKRTREGFVSGVKEILALIEAHLPRSKTPAARQKAALAIFSTMLGALQLARVTSDLDLSGKVLDAAREAALDLAKD